MERLGPVKIATSKRVSERDPAEPRFSFAHALIVPHKSASTELLRGGAVSIDRGTRSLSLLPLTPSRTARCKAIES